MVLGPVKLLMFFGKIDYMDWGSNKLSALTVLFSYVLESSRSVSYVEHILIGIVDICYAAPFI